jgi:DNA-binding MarR family transcriptional regulator
MSNHLSSRPRGDFLGELPFQIASLTLGFQSLISRLRREVGLAEHVALGMGSIYFALLEEDGCRLKDIGDRLGMPKGTLSGLLTRMEQQGWITRNDCPEDGRARRIRLTAKALRREPALRERHRRALQVLQSGLSAKEVAQLRALLKKVLANLRPAGA